MKIPKWAKILFLLLFLILIACRTSADTFLATATPTATASPNELRGDGWRIYIVSSHSLALEAGRHRLFETAGSWESRIKSGLVEIEKICTVEEISPINTTPGGVVVLYSIDVEDSSCIQAP